MALVLNSDEPLLIFHIESMSFEKYKDTYFHLFKEVSVS